ncbi:hypothetical protein [Acidianus ambivalens]|uniref:Uncharacterized protein n=1 Tax=Acidianus ambivalens TaxID=2283 RepID=A0A650CXB3_ACIAM|nr:hypothetical protein [Acidianus ambivalens]MQL54633.1 hypothetical protein [Acidianus ambivalens]QGR22438.1 hypothetical protein D1866_10975 [Acidianus ambivalens]
MENENNGKRQPCFMRKDIYDEIRRLTELNGSSIYNYTNDLLAASIQMEKNGVDIKNEISTFILLSKLMNNYKGFMILVPFEFLKDSQMSLEKWKELGKSLMSYVGQLMNNVEVSFLSILRFFLSFIGDVNVDYNGKYIESFSPYFQGKIIDFIKSLIDGMLEVSNLKADVSATTGMIRVKLISTKDTKNEH